MKDIVGKDIKVGDIVSSPSWDYGTTMRVVSIDGSRLGLVRAYRGRKVVCLNGSNWLIVSR